MQTTPLLYTDIVLMVQKQWFQGALKDLLFPVSSF